MGTLYFHEYFHSGRDSQTLFHLPFSLQTRIPRLHENHAAEPERSRNPSTDAQIQQERRHQRQHLVQRLLPIFKPPKQRPVVFGTAAEDEVAGVGSHQGRGT